MEIGELENEDSSTISFRRFNERPEDTYPDITFCFNGGHLKESTEELDISKNGFSDVLRGDASLEEIAPNTFRKIATSDSKSYFISLEDILLTYSFKTNVNVTSYDIL